MDGARANVPAVQLEHAQLERLAGDDARIRLEWANRSSKATICVLFAPDPIGHHLLLKAAIDETSSKMTFFDATGEYTEAFSAAVENDAAIVVLDDRAFRAARHAGDQVVHVRDVRPKMRPLIIRVGEQPLLSEIGFYLARFPALKLQETDPPREATWRLVPLFLMEQIARAQTA